nr:ATP-dependent DNA helicase PIF7-like [Tanacetum cinerariifolium]
MLTNLDNRLLREALSFDVTKSKVEHEKLHSMLNPEQHLIYEQIIESVHNEKGQFCFIHGPGGTGKTFLYKTIISRLKSKQLIVLAVASSGRTAHSSFVIPLELMENSTCGRTAHSRFVIPLELMKNSTCESKDEPTWIEIPKEFLIKSWTSPIEQIITETYPDFTLRQGDDEYLIERAILTPRNDDADAINKNMFKKLGGAPVTYNSANKICKASTDTTDQTTYTQSSS